MIIKGKEIKAEIITMWINVFSFIVGIVFYIRLENKYENPTPIVQVNSATKDSVFYLNTDLKHKLHHLKQTQDSLIAELKRHQSIHIKQTQHLKTVRQQLSHTINSDWDSLSTEQQQQYIKQLFINLKKQTPNQ